MVAFDLKWDCVAFERWNYTLFLLQMKNDEWIKRTLAQIHTLASALHQASDG